MIYLYAHTNHKADLDSLRRMGALWKILRDEGIEAELLVNDYRAQLAGREMGLPLATTIETILDIDAVAQLGDSVVIDSSEEAPERLELYRQKFTRVLRLSSCSKEGDTIDPFAPESYLFDPLYARAASEVKKERKVLIFRDADPEKELLAQAESFRGLGLELYWGTYFYVKYEEALAELFDSIYESEEYEELVITSHTVVTAMPQTALEARAAGAAVIYLERGETPVCLKERFKGLGILQVKMGDRSALQRAMEEVKPTGDMLHPQEKFWVEKLQK